jgi:hypothetical protein
MRKFLGIIFIFGTIYLSQKTLGEQSWFPESPAQLGLRLVSLASLGFGVFLLRAKKRVF